MSVKEKASTYRGVARDKTRATVKRKRKIVPGPVRIDKSEAEIELLNRSVEAAARAFDR
jgi:hypothetical protein